jgi:hypothetical protein
MCLWLRITSSPEEGGMMITFDPDTHTYTIDGQQVPSVTGILADIGFIDSQWFTDYARERGKLVHRIIHWHITGELDEDTIDPVLRGYFNAWLAFEKDTGFVSTATEEPLGSEIYRFAGTPDYVGTMNGSEVLIDAKTGAAYPATQLQTAAYEILLNRKVKRFSLHLTDSGKYKLVEHKDRQDRGIFLAALSCWHWQRNQRRAA